MDYKWKQKPDPDKLVVLKVQQELNIPFTIAKILAQRDITNFDDARNFFRPRLDQLHDPFLMKDMDKAIARVEEALGNGERILIYGDYDVDGTTSVALVYTYFSSFYESVGYYIPDRYKEGYGISFAGIDYAEENDYSLIIALDCGIKAIEQVAYANKKSIDFIICDHHEPGKRLPDAKAVLDPKRNDCAYPYKELSGCGIGLKLTHAFSLKNIETGIDPFLLLDFVAISIACDIVPVTEENRILASFGLKILNENPRSGIKHMVELGKRKHQLTISDLVFFIGPRINAAGRINHGSQAVEFLVGTKPEEAKELAVQINGTNTERMELDKQTTLEALEIVGKEPSAKSTVVYQEHWHKGVIGIVASRLIENFYRPTIVLTKSKEGVYAGSARSVKGFSVYSAIEQCEELLEQFGGHKYAAGLTLKEDNLKTFKTKFEKVVSKTITEEQLVPSFEYDAEISLDEITSKFYRILEQMGPFGPYNMRPTFCTRGVVDTGYSKTVGQENDHLKLDITQNDIPNSFGGIAFKFGYLYNEIASKKPFDILYTIEENTWNGKTTLQLNIKDIKMAL